VPRLKERYRQEIAPALREEFAYANVMQIPTLTKIVVNMGVGEAARDAKLIDGALRDLTVITGQKHAVAQARKSIAQFKLREGMRIGAHGTRANPHRRSRNSAGLPDVGLLRPAAFAGPAPDP
jgi:large subunit ribosomal protein L5